MGKQPTIEIILPDIQKRNAINLHNRHLPKTGQRLNLPLVHYGAARATGNDICTSSEEKSEAFHWLSDESVAPGFCDRAACSVAKHGTVEPVIV